MQKWNSKYIQDREFNLNESHRAIKWTPVNEVFNKMSIKLLTILQIGSFPILSVKQKLNSQFRRVVVRLALTDDLDITQFESD